MKPARGYDVPLRQLARDGDERELLLVERAGHGAVDIHAHVVLARTQTGHQEVEAGVAELAAKDRTDIRTGTAEQSRRHELSGPNDTVHDRKGPDVDDVHARTRGGAKIDRPSAGV